MCDIVSVYERNDLNLENIESLEVNCDASNCFLYL